MNKLQIICLVVLGFLASCTLSAKIFSFTHETQYFLEYDFKSKDVDVNTTIESFKFYDVLNYDSNKQEFELFVSNGSQYDNGVNYYFIKFNITSGDFLNGTQSITSDAQIGNKGPTFQIVDNVYYLPINLEASQSLSILELNFNHGYSEIINFEIDDYNQGYNPSSSYNEKNNEFYTLYFGLDLNPYIQILNLPITNGTESGSKIYKFPKNLPTLSALNPIGQLFSISGNSDLYYITRLGNQLTICSIDLTNLNCENVFSISNDYTDLYTPYFINYQTSELISVTQMADTAQYQVVDLTTFKITNTYTSPNFYSCKNNSPFCLDNFYYLDNSN